MLETEDQVASALPERGVGWQEPRTGSIAGLPTTSCACLLAVPTVCAQYMQLAIKLPLSSLHTGIPQYLQTGSGTSRYQNPRRSHQSHSSIYTQPTYILPCTQIISALLTTANTM